MSNLLGKISVIKGAKDNLRHEPSVNGYVLMIHRSVSITMERSIFQNEKSANKYLASKNNVKMNFEK